MVESNSFNFVIVIYKLKNRRQIKKQEDTTKNNKKTKIVINKVIIVCTMYLSVFKKALIYFNIFIW